MELLWVKEAQIQGNMSSSLSTAIEITDTDLHYMQNARHADSLSTFLTVTCFQIPDQLHFMQGSTGLMTRIFFGEKCRTL